jgi:hypothetical protein
MYSFRLCNLFIMALRDNYCIKLVKISCKSNDRYWLKT